MRGVHRAKRGFSISLVVNGQRHELTTGEPPAAVSPEHTLAHTLRETLGLKGTKVSCDHGACGCCTVLVDGQPMLSCTLLTIECDNKSITTIEGLRESVKAALHPIQRSFIDHGAYQCGFCTPGIIMTTKGLLDENPTPTEDEVKEALSGNFCRCITHYQVVKAVMDVTGSENDDGQVKR
jgi:carbon-monoxide dehydrogenase small subunit